MLPGAPGREAYVRARSPNTRRLLREAFTSRGGVEGADCRGFYRLRACKEISVTESLRAREPGTSLRSSSWE